MQTIEVDRSTCGEAIHPDCYYAIGTVKRILGIGGWAWRAQRFAKIKSVRIGNRRAVKGAEVIAHLDALAAQQHGDAE